MGIETANLERGKIVEKIVLLGCGGHAKSVVDTIECQGFYKIIGFIDNSRKDFFEYRGYRIIGTDDDLEKLYRSGISNAFVCIGYMGKGGVREKLYHKLKSIGFSIPVIADPTSIIAGDVIIKEGAFIGKRTVVNAGAEIGELAILNTGAIIEHECVVEEYSHVAVGAVLCGNVRVGSCSFIGAGSTVIQGIKIGASVIIGAGSTVIRNVEDGRKAVGLVKN